MASRAVLAPTNSTVDSVNSYVTDIFPGQAVECLSADATVGEEQEPVPQEYLNGLCVPGLPPHHLLLKPGMPVILLRNIDPARGLCNGTRLLVVAVHGGRLLEATVACGSAAGRRVLIPRLTLQPPDDAFPFEWRRRQFPVRPAFALTINKAQGQTLRRVAVLLREPVFGHGQLYVAASRVGRWRDLRFVLPPGSGGRTANVVYRDVL
ncbi:ATP-dependent DNA helicase PIF6-like [Amphibalanus amphitrite]|nr:ATP-dependent DNA helicase PIF6-like [Amphibalanus amphitrite]